VRGGARGGDGGFVEVSGKGGLVFAGTVNALAPYGNAGSLLLDPTNIEVITGGTATLAQVDQFADADLTTCASMGGAACSKIEPANDQRCCRERDAAGDEQHPVHERDQHDERRRRADRDGADGSITVNARSPRRIARRAGRPAR
jgi:hypothetical protein